MKALHIALLASLISSGALAEGSRPDPSTAAMMVLLRTDPETLDEVFGADADARVFRGLATTRTLDQVLHVLRDETGPSAHFEVGISAFLGSSRRGPLTYQTAGGDGFVLQLDRSREQIHLEACPVGGGKAYGQVLDETLAVNDLVLLRARLDGQPHVVAMFFAIPRFDEATKSEDPAYRQVVDRFRESLRGRGAKDSVILAANEPSGEVASYLLRGH